MKGQSPDTPVSVIIPAYNEEQNIEATLRGLEGIEEIGEIIVVDDGSADRTAALAAAGGARVMELAANMGKGRAMQEGLEHAENEIIAFLDADLGETAAEVKKLLLPVLAGETDMAVGRWPKGKGRSGFGVAQGLAQWGIRRLAGFTCASPLSGQRVIKREFLAELEEGFGVEVGMTIDCLRKGGRMQEVPVNMKHRFTGRDWQGFRHRGRQFWCVAGVLLKKFRGGGPWK